MSDSKMMSWFQTATRNIKIPEKFIEIQKTLRNGKFHGWTDVFDRDYDGSTDFEEEFKQENLDKNSSGYLKDEFVVEDDNSVLSDITEEENDDDDSDYLGSDEDDHQNESDHNETDDEDSEYLESDEDEESEYLPSDEDIEVLPKNSDEEFDENEDILDFIFPITIIFNDYTEVVIENEEQLENFITDCDDEVDDDVIECIDFVYQI